MRRIAFYSYDEHGLGHVRRSIAIAHALAAAEPSSILLVAGAREAALFKLPGGHRHARAPGAEHRLQRHAPRARHRPRQGRHGPGPRPGPAQRARRVRPRGADRRPAAARRPRRAAREPRRPARDGHPPRARPARDPRRPGPRAGGVRALERVRRPAPQLRRDLGLRRPARLRPRPPSTTCPRTSAGWSATPATSTAAPRSAPPRRTSPPAAASCACPTAAWRLCVLGGGEDGHALADGVRPRRAARRARTGVVVAGPFMPDAEREAAPRPRRRARRPARPRLRPRRGRARSRSPTTSSRWAATTPSARSSRPRTRALVVPRARAAPRAGHPRPPPRAPSALVDMLEPGELRAGRDRPLARRRRRRAAPPRPPRSTCDGLARIPGLLDDLVAGAGDDRRARASPTRRASCGSPRAARRAQGASRREARGALPRARPGVARRSVAAARGPRRAPAARPPAPRRDGVRARRARCAAAPTIEDLRVTLVDYQPGSGATVAYDVAIAGARHVAVATAGHALCPEAVRTDARRAIARALGRHVADRAPADLRRRPRRARAVVPARPRDAGARPAGARAAAPRRARGDRGRERRRRALDARLPPGPARRHARRRRRPQGLRRGRRVPRGRRRPADRGPASASAAGPRLHGALPELRLTVQSALDGTPVRAPRAREVAPIAGAMLRVLHDAAVPGLPIAGADRMLASAAARARGSPPPSRPALARRDARPPRPPRGARARPRRARRPPTATSTSASCSTSRARSPCSTSTRRASRRAALDVASYAANLVSGRAGRPRPRRRRARRRCSTATASAAASPVTGTSPAALLRRAPSPFRLHKRDWLAAHRGDRRGRRGGARAVKLVMLMSGFPRRSETFALNELLALDRAGCLEAVFATKPGEPGPPPARRRARSWRRSSVLAPGTPAEQAEEVVARLERRDGERRARLLRAPARPRSPRRPRAASASRTASASTPSTRARSAAAASPTARRDAACVIACNPDVAGDLRRRRRAASQLMPHGVDLERFRPSPPPPAEVADDPRRRAPRRRRRASRSCSTRRRALLAPFTLRIVGDGAERARRSSARIAEHGLGDRVELVGPRTHDELPRRVRRRAHRRRAVGHGRDGRPRRPAERRPRGDVERAPGRRQRCRRGRRARSSTGAPGVLVPPGDAARARRRHRVPRRPARHARAPRPRGPRPRRGRLRAAQLHRPPARLPGDASMPDHRPGRLRPQGLAADLGALHRERDLPPRAGRPAAAAVRDQAAGRGPDAPGRRPHPGADRVPAADDEPVGDDARRAGCARTSPVPAGPARAPPAATRVGLARAAGLALAQSVRARKGRFAWPRKLYVKELLQAVALADRLADAPDVRHLHAHFAHGTTTVTWLCSAITGLPFSFTGHAKDIYSPSLNPAGLLRRKLLAARFAVTCTEANARHLKAIAPEAVVHRVYHGLNADFSRLMGEERAAAAPGPNGKLRASRGRAPRGEEGLRRRRRRVRRARPPRRPVRGRDRRARRRRRPGAARAASPSSASTARIRLEGQMSQERAATPSTAARPRSACRAGSSTTATATASRTCSPRRWPAARRS